MHASSKSALRFTIALYAIVAVYFYYLFYSLWQFLGQNFFPQNVSSVLSIQNGNFQIVHIFVASIATLLVLAMLVAYKKLRNYFLDVGDELSRVSWPTLQEAQKSTALVIIIVIVVGFVLFFADTVFLKVINFIMNTAA
ncbi:MAG: preprotein translocase subunit SecE [Bdellovibrionota bacterium]